MYLKIKTVLNNSTFPCCVCGSAEPSWTAAALCVVSLCVILSCVICVWKKCMKKKDKDKEKEKKKGKEKSKGGFDTEMDGSYNEVGQTHTHVHPYSHLPQIHRPCNVSSRSS